MSTYDQEEFKSTSSTDKERDGKNIIINEEEYTTMTQTESEESNLNLKTTNGKVDEEYKSLNNKEDYKSLSSIEKGESKFKTSNVNTDRLVPRSHQRKRELSSSSSHETREKRQREGAEELQRLRCFVPRLRDREQEGQRLRQVDIIEETISYISQLHRRIAERMLDQSEDSQEQQGSSTNVPVLTLEAIQDAERLAECEVESVSNSDSDFSSRLAELSRSASNCDPDKLCDNDGEKNICDDKFKNSEDEDKRKRELVDDDSSDDESLTDEQMQAIEVIKSTFVNIISNIPDE